MVYWMGMRSNICISTCHIKFGYFIMNPCIGDFVYILEDLLQCLAEENVMDILQSTNMSVSG